MSQSMKLLFKEEGEKIKTQILLFFLSFPQQERQKGSPLPTLSPVGSHSPFTWASTTPTLHWGPGAHQGVGAHLSLILRAGGHK